MNEDIVFIEKVSKEIFVVVGIEGNVDGMKDLVTIKVNRLMNVVHFIVIDKIVILVNIQGNLDFGKNLVDKVIYFVNIIEGVIAFDG